LAYSGNASGTLFAEGGAGALRLLAYLTISVILMVADHRGGYLQQLRSWLALLNEPLYRIAAAPAEAVSALRDALVGHQSLSAQRDELQAELLVARAQLSRLDAVQRENARLRDLMGGARGLQLRVQLAALSDIDLDPFRHRILLDRGSRAGVRSGLAIIDAAGLVGQVTEVTALRATAILISDPSHAVPVQVQRSGLRTIAFGSGDPDRLVIPNIPQSADIRIGDLLVTSGMGGGFPAGLHVARITRLQPDETRLFGLAEARPVAALDRSGEVLLVWDSHEAGAIDFGPPAPTTDYDSAEPSP
jgi:rod shape-determining protein MreC